MSSDPISRRMETSLYGPVKRYLETLGFNVKGEVCGGDLVALRGDEPPMVVVGELKLSFSLCFPQFGGARCMSAHCRPRLSQAQISLSDHDTADPLAQNVGAKGCALCRLVSTW